MLACSMLYEAAKAAEITNNSLHLLLSAQAQASNTYGTRYDLSLQHSIHCTWPHLIANEFPDMHPHDAAEINDFNDHDCSHHKDNWIYIHTGNLRCQLGLNQHT